MENNHTDTPASKSISLYTSLWDKIDDYCAKNYLTRSSFFKMLCDPFFKIKESEITEDVNKSG